MVAEGELLGRVRRMAARQDGVLTGRQASRLGVPSALVRRIVRAGAWVPLARGSYWVVPNGLPRLATRVRAALLACGPRAVVVGPTAARLQGSRACRVRRTRPYIWRARRLGSPGLGCWCTGSAAGSAPRCAGFR
ncbi:type IV toxin-antitoxin system AbiEi family antitoxin domain-containing protein [Streptomyces sp. N2-109]|uniref:Type IV toxin-antitoxin system AbiEi family antitoxin domain-containing protein n=2 Tax=Streptomyces gossypii TaxID=2883101 RepID=A0ABT2JP76_9ACTN|nr:type IV toxin-antitoxin system AbiEi family antitoxin domain-containing protein [Streptomyces gossypii]